MFRTVPDPFLDAVDRPDGSAATAVRGVSTTAAQALAMLNDAFLIRQCEHMADLLTSKAGTPESQVDAAFRLIMLRSATAKERDRFAAYARQYGLAKSACHILLNCNEFIYIWISHHRAGTVLREILIRDRSSTSELLDAAAWRAGHFRMGVSAQPNAF